MKAVRTNEKFFFLLGGLFGFCLIFFIDLFMDVNPDVALRNGLIGAIVGAISMRVFLHIFYKGVKSVIEEKSKAAAVSDDNPTDESTK